MTETRAPAGVTLQYRYPGSAPVAVRLLQEVVRASAPLELTRSPAGGAAADARWEIRFEPAGVDRFEYRFEVLHEGGLEEFVCDPANPLRASGAFGERSVVELAGYEPPAWTRARPPRGEVREIGLASPILGSEQPALLWAARGTSPEDVLPLLVALDGPELARYSGLVQMLEALTYWRALPPMRAALLQPTRRDDHYSANPAFAQALAGELLPAIGRLAPHPEDPAGRAGLGTSLGGLALLHAHRAVPGSFGSLFLQSGSYLRRGRLRGFEYVGRIEDFVEEVICAPAWSAPISVGLTCGTVEETLPDNREMEAALRRQGYDVSMRVVRDAHNWIAWRDAWTPGLVALLGSAWR